MTTSVMARKGMTSEIRQYLSQPFPPGDLTKYATSCATPEIKLTGETHPVNATHELLLEYARTRATTTPSGTIETVHVMVGIADWLSDPGQDIPKAYKRSAEDGPDRCQVQP